MVEGLSNAPCAQDAMSKDSQLREWYDMLQREGGVDKAPVHPKSKRQRWMDSVYEYYVNSLLSGVYTQAKNIAGNTVPLAARVTETAAAIPISKIQKAMGQDVDMVTYNELVAEAGGVGAGFVDAFTFISKRVKSMFDQGVSNEDILKEINMPAKLAAQAKIERQNRQITGANIDNAIMSKMADWVGIGVNIPGASLSAMDVFFKVINYRAELSKQAMRIANNSGTTDAKQIKDIYETVIGEVAQGKRKDLVEGGIANADRQTFTNAPAGKINDQMAKSGHDIPGLRWIVPFRRTMVNIINYGVERTALAYPLNSRTRAAFAKGGAEQAEAISRMAVGTATLMGIYATAGGHMTGEAPRDAQARDAWIKNGNEAFSIQVGGVNVDMELFGPMTPFLKSLGEFQRLASSADYDIDENGNEVVQGLAEHLAFATADAFYSEHWMSSISGFMSVLDRARRDNVPDALYEWGARMATGFNPRIVQGVAKYIDPGVKDMTDGFDRFLAKVPFMSTLVSDKIDLWGDVMTHQHFMDPTLASTITGKDQVTQNMFDLNMTIPVSGKTQRGVTMTSKEYQQFMVLSGKGTFGAPPLREALAEAMQSDLYLNTLADAGKTAYIKSIIGQYRKGALGYMELNTDWGKRVAAQREKVASAQLQGGIN